MSIEELGLGDTSIASFSIPPARAIAVQVCAAGTLDGDAGAGDLEEGAIPFFVAPGCFSFEDDLVKIRTC